jgi:DNA-binding transcriptional ArsR family regulator
MWVWPLRGIEQMSQLLPLRTPVERSDTEPRVLDIDDEDADDVLAALSSDTARDVLTAAYEEPRPASELAEAADTSLQNARYHLEKLCDAGLLEVADTWYSERGTEMKVYAPTNGPVAVVAGGDSRSVRDALAGLLGAFAVLSVLSLGVQWLLARSASGGGVQAADATGGGPGAAGSLTVEPGLLFFLGGLVVLAALWLWAARRHPVS